MQISPGIERKTSPDPDASIKYSTPFAARVLVNHFDEIGDPDRIDRFIRTEALRQLSFARVRIADEEKALVTAARCANTA